MARPAARGISPIPPDKGSFPLDHYADCKDNMKLYMNCIREHANQFTDACKQQAKAYLQCRMDKLVRINMANQI
jgi:cytochrome c oxidase assembly protein subunit 19